MGATISNSKHQHHQINSHAFSTPPKVHNGIGGGIHNRLVQLQCDPRSPTEDEMLAQILHDLHVPPELLDGLPDDQKQLLFCKMREEQIRRYHEREEEEELQAAIRGTTRTDKKKKKKKQVTFRMGSDGHEWCWVMGEPNPSGNGGEQNGFDEPLYIRNNNELMEIDLLHDRGESRTATAGAARAVQTKNEVYYTVHRDELDIFLGSTQKTALFMIRKQIEEISNNIQEARRIFERLESDTRRLVVNKEDEILQQQQQQQERSRPAPSQTDLVDEMSYREVEERAKKADRDRREAARRARDNFRRDSMQLNVCFDTDNKTTLVLQPPPLGSSTQSNRFVPREKNVEIEFVETAPSPAPSFNGSKKDSPDVVNYHRSPLLPLTREDIRQWFRTSEIPYGTFRSSNGQIFPWFHGIITRAYAEQLLRAQPIGTYLIRVNEKIFGYALSYRASDHCRHLLIESISSTSTKKRDENRMPPSVRAQHSYRFLGGAKSEIFAHIGQLIEKYSNTPIRSNSTDMLRFPCGQIDAQRPDYSDLFVDHAMDRQQQEPLYISLETTTSSPQSTTHL